MVHGRCNCGKKAVFEYLITDKKIARTVIFCADCKPRHAIKGMQLVDGKFQTDTLINNAGDEVKYIKGLKKGDILIAKKLVKEKGDIGMSGRTYNYEAFIPGKEYEVSKIYNWQFSLVAYVADEDSTLHFATPDIFDVKEPKSI